MPAPNEPDRRFSLALTAAVAATTVAIGVTAATLLGWFRTAEPATAATAASAEPATPATPAAPAVVYVPIAPTTPDPPAVLASDTQLAVDGERHHHHEDEREDDDD